jgi:demethoxyubiquinone hydroxylase (CLK1/Coq7/Cat5 family)
VNRNVAIEEMVGLLSDMLNDIQSEYKEKSLMGIMEEIESLEEHIERHYDELFDCMGNKNNSLLIPVKKTLSAMEAIITKKENDELSYLDYYIKELWILYKFLKE